MSAKRIITKHEYYMQLAEVTAIRSTCDRAMVGAIIVKNDSVVATGYNGSVKGAPHCDDIGHQIENGHCVRTVHAELNAILQAAKNGVGIDGASIYCTLYPCGECQKAIINSGIKKVYYRNNYTNKVKLIKCTQI